ncbi:MAG: methyltransferase domain-containing protein [Candidatus Izimaplasma sp.]|nr:methyltransferase domain-containing protein [Candidatus Izimaplasma bacterium]
MIKKVIPFVHNKLKETVTNEDYVIDGTCGNGYDTLFLSRIAKKVFAFDIQELAIKNTEERLRRNKVYNVKMIQDSHENVDKYIKDKEIKAALFNLGHLPGSDKRVVTKWPSTMKAIQKIKNNLVVNGIIALVVYVGKFGGEEESNELLSYVRSLSHEEYNVIKYSYFNKEKAPYVIIIKKNK